MRVFVVLITTLFLAGVPAWGDSSRTLVGEYYWTGGKVEGQVTAHFVPVSETSWTVDFDFRFDGQDHRYSGTAEGSLDSGVLEGTVKTENGKRTFSFRGRVAEGRFSGTHSDVTRGKSQQTGSLTLAAK